MALTFSCRCGASITVPDVLAGHEGRCPACDLTLRAPARQRPANRADAAAATTPAPAAVRVVTATPRGVLAPATKARLILEFPCPGCGEVLRVGLANAGRSGRCTLCSTTFDVPTPPPEPTATDTPPAVGTRPTRDAFKVVRVTCACGREVATPLARLEQGLARCPTCDRLLAS